MSQTPFCSICNTKLEQDNKEDWKCPSCKAVYHSFEQMKYEDEFTSSHEDEFPELGGHNIGGASPLESGDEETDGSIIDQLYKDPRKKPNQGEGANTWEV